MEKAVSIKVSGISKIYKLYGKSIDKVKEAFSLTRKKRYEEFYALNQISFEVYKGETFGIVGTNGSGKSTLLKIITGVVKPNSGTIHIDGKVSALLELGAGFNPEYTGMENIYLNGTTMGYSREEMKRKVPTILDFADIGDFISQPVKNYSSGMFARLAFAVAINVEPDILIVDEALSVGDVFFQNKCFKKFEELRSQGITILFVSHDIGSVKQMCSRVLWIERGIQQMCGDSVEVCNAYSNSIKNKSFFVEKENEGEYHVRKFHLGSHPQIHYSKESQLNDDVIIKSAFFEDGFHHIVTELEAGKEYTFVQIFESKRAIEKCITGFVIETLKGLWIINCNSAICGNKEPFPVSGDSMVRTEFKFTMPPIMKGSYIIGTAVSEGEIEDFKVLTWLYQVMNITVVNHGANSAVIDVFPQIEVLSAEIDRKKSDTECARSEGRTPFLHSDI